MREHKRKRLEAAGWKIGTAAEFLGLSPEEAQYVDLKLKLAEGLRARRLRRKMAQIAFAKLIHSSQSRVAKMEAADGSVSIDLLVRSLLAIGTSAPEIGRIIAGRHPAAAGR